MGPLKIPITSEWNILNLNQIVIVVENFFFQYDTSTEAEPLQSGWLEIC